MKTSCSRFTGADPMRQGCCNSGSWKASSYFWMEKKNGMTGRRQPREPKYTTRVKISAVTSDEAAARQTIPASRIMKKTSTVAKAKLSSGEMVPGVEQSTE